MKIREVIRLIEADGWFSIGQEGSHPHFKHVEETERLIREAIEIHLRGMKERP